MSNRPPDQDLAPGLRFVNEDDGRWKLEAEHIRVIVDIVGEPLLLGLARCLVVAERLSSLLDLVHLNQAGTEPESIRQNRNLDTIVSIVCGLVVELSDAARSVDQDTNIRARLSAAGRKRWQQLLELVALRRAPTLRKIRNKLAFHAPDEETLRRGLRRLGDDSRPIRILAGDGEAHVGTTREFARELALAGINIPHENAGSEREGRRLDIDDLQQAYEHARDAHLASPRILEEVFLDLLREGGARLLQIEVDEPQEENS